MERNKKLWNVEQTRRKITPEEKCFTIEGEAALQEKERESFYKKKWEKEHISNFCEKKLFKRSENTFSYVYLKCHFFSREIIVIYCWKMQLSKEISQNYLKTILTTLIIHFYRLTKYLLKVFDNDL